MVGRTGWRLLGDQRMHHASFTRPGRYPRMRSYLELTARVTQCPLPPSQAYASLGADPAGR